MHNCATRLYNCEKCNITIIINIQYNIIEKAIFESLKPTCFLKYKFNVGAIEDKNVENLIIENIYFKDFAGKSLDKEINEEKLMDSIMIIPK